MQWSKVNNAFQSFALRRVNQASRIFNLSAMHDPMADDVRGIPRQVVHQFVEG